MSKDIVLDVVLHDMASNNENSLKCKIEVQKNWIFIGAEGYGEKEAEPGYGFPVSIEFYEGQLRLLYRRDINEADPVIINLQGARESNRR